MTSLLQDLTQFGFATSNRIATTYVATAQQQHNNRIATAQEECRDAQIDVPTIVQVIFPPCRFTQGKPRSQAVRMLRRMSSLTGWEKDNFAVLRCRCITDLTLEMEKMQMQCFFIRSHGRQGGWVQHLKTIFSVSVEHCSRDIHPQDGLPQCLS